MNKITVTVSGQAGSGKSAVAQAIQMLLTSQGLHTSVDLSVDLRKAKDLDTVVESIKASTQIVVCEVQEPCAAQEAERKPSVYDAVAFGRTLLSASASYGRSPVDPMADWHEGLNQWSWPINFKIEYLDQGNDKVFAQITCDQNANVRPLHTAIAILTGQAITSAYIGVNGNSIMLTRYASYLFKRLPIDYMLNAHGQVVEFTFTQDALEIV